MRAAQVSQEDGIHTSGVVGQSQVVLCEQIAQGAARVWVHRQKFTFTMGLQKNGFQ